MNWLHRLKVWWTTKVPEQLELPFYCGLYGEACDYSEDLFHGAFYNTCCQCGVQYDPVCDR